MAVEEVVAAAGAAKAVFDSLRSAIGILKDVKDALPKEQQEAATLAIAASEKQIVLAEAEIAQALGYQLCKCQFPPVIMLTVGNKVDPRTQKSSPVYECPSCGLHTSYPYGFSRTPPKP